MKKNILTFLLLGMAVLLISGCGESGKDNSWQKVKDKNQFVLGLDDSFPPMGFRDENGKIVGFDVDLAKEVCTRLQVKLKLQPINWDAKEQELNSGKIDCIWNGFTITEERQNKLLFTKPYMKNRQVLIVTAGSTYSTQTDLKGKKLGLQAGSSAADALNSVPDFKDSLGDVVEFDDNMTALMDLEKGGIDTVLMDEIVARYYIKNKHKKYQVLDQELASEEYGIGFRKKDQKLMEKVQETLEAISKDGKMKKISTKWFGEDITVIGAK
ncbi:MAG: amino acid ABC transporter substrate-binding protein [Bacillota bacterium]|jgi:polar amino acid transport system substrate-binding protein